MKSLARFLSLSSLSLVKNEGHVKQPVKRAAANTIYIYDVIDPYFGVSGAEVVSALDSMTGDVTVRINSPGGAVDEGVLIYNTLVRYAREKKGKVRVEIDGLAASIATVISMAGSTRAIAETALFMIHDPWTYTAGSAKDLRALADLLDLAKQVNLLPAYKSKSNLSEERISSLMEDETWMSPATAKEYGFVTDIITAAATDRARAALSMDLLINSAKSWDLRAMGKLPSEFEFLPSPAVLDKATLPTRVSEGHPGPVFFGKPATRFTKKA